MVDVNSQDLPSRVIEVLRIFLAASSRGEQAVLTLETRKGMLTTKYRSVETVAGVPATTSTSTTHKKMNPARARRSRLRLEAFKNKKEEEKKQKDLPAAGDSAVDDRNRKDKRDTTTVDEKDASNSTKRLVLELDKVEDIPLSKELASPILQVDGCENQLNERVFFTFHSEFGEEDIMYSLSEIFPEKVVTSTTLLSRVRQGRTADHKCMVEIKLAAGQTEDFSWPEMPAWHADVFQELKRIR